MKNLMLSTALLTILAGPVLAQTETTTGSGDAAATAAADGLFRSAPGEADILASDFIGMRLYASEAPVDADAYEGVQDAWEDIGEVNDVILSQDGTVQGVLVDIGGFLGIAERQVAVEMSSIRFVRDDATADNDSDFFLVMNAGRAALESAPAWTVSDIEAGADAGTAGTDQTAGSDDTMAPAAGGTGADTAATGTEGSTRTPIVREGYATVEREALTSETLTGATVYDAQDQRIGEVSELVLTPEGQVSEAVLDVGGFLGIGAKQVALPIADVDILQSQDGGTVRVYVPHTKEQLEAMPEFEG